MARKSDTPVFDSMDGTRTLRVLNASWKRARAVAQRNLSEIENLELMYSIDPCDECHTILGHRSTCSHFGDRPA